MADNPIASVIAGQEYFRLKRVISSPGDIFELDQSTRAIYIGPESDIAEVQLVYYNPDEPLGLETAIVAVNGPFVGRLDALMAQKVSSTGQPARILVSPNDIVNNNYQRPQAGVGGPPFRRFNVPAQIDLICALKTLPAIPEVRADRTFRLINTPFSAPTVGPVTDGSTDIVVPIYARRMTSIQIVSPIGVGYRATFYGVALQPGLDTDPALLGSYTQGGATIQITRNSVIRASQSVQGSIPAQSSTIDEIVGQCDLLVINIAENPAFPVGAGNDYVDIFVRISDRET